MWWIIIMLTMVISTSSFAEDRTKLQTIRIKQTADMQEKLPNWMKPGSKEKPPEIKPAPWQLPENKLPQ